MNIVIFSILYCIILFNVLCLRNFLEISYTNFDSFLNFGDLCREKNSFLKNFQVFFMKKYFYFLKEYNKMANILLQAV